MVGYRRKGSRERPNLHANMHVKVSNITSRLEFFEVITMYCDISLRILPCKLPAKVRLAIGRDDEIEFV
jgi:hypothetical protein